MNKFFLLSFIFTVLFNCLFSQNENKIIIHLTKNWQFRQAGTANWLSAKVPGTVHTDLLSNQIIEDPFYRINEKKLQWIDKVNWEYKTTFEITNEVLKKNKIIIEFKGLDTYADVFLNETKILSANNMFREWQAECKAYLKAGTNILRIYFHSPIQIGLKKLEDNDYPLPASNDQSENGGLGTNAVSPFVRKAPYHFGWDWGPRFVTSGIWRPVHIIAWNKAKIQNVYFKTTEISKNEAKISAEYEINSDNNQTISFELSINSKSTKIQNITLQKGINIITIPFVIKNPKLWYCSGYGEQNIYSSNTKLTSDNSIIDEQNENFGIKQLKLVQATDENNSGKSFYFELNSIPVFAKGANYIPLDIFLPRVKSTDYERIIKSAKDANMNMLRVWGGGIYENDYFYDLCDKYGIMVWQDFMYACSMYPGNDDFLKNIKQEAIDNLKRLRNHPCIVLWCGNNEIEQAWAEYKENTGWGWKEQYTKEQRTEIWTAYDKLFHLILPEAVKQYTEIPYWHSSPSAGMGQLANHENKSGDMHYWGVWHAKQPFTDFYKYIGRFMSEYGFQSFPEFNTVKQYTLPTDWDITSEVMTAHQRSGIGNLRIKEYMEPMYKQPKDFESFLYVSHLLQAEAIKMAIEAHRSKMPYCMGSLYWQINDCWPVASWSSIDYYGRWKALHYFAKKAYQPIIIIPKVENDSTYITIVSDYHKQTSLLLDFQLMDFEGKILEEKIGKTVKIIPDKSIYLIKYKLNTNNQSIDKKNTFLLCKLRNDTEVISENILYFTHPKELLLTKTEIRAEIYYVHSHYEIKLKSKKLIKNIWLSIDNEGFFSDNYFDMIPNKEYTIIFTANKSFYDFEKRLQIKSLVDSY